LLPAYYVPYAYPGFCGEGDVVGDVKAETAEEERKIVTENILLGYIILFLLEFM
jgi:hypothetical protein